MTAGSRWCQVLRAAKAARSAAWIGPRTAARAGAIESASAAHGTRLAVACVLAAQAAKNEFLTDLRTFWRELEAGDQFQRDMARQAPARRTRRLSTERRAPLPVEAARAVPIVQLLQRYGHELRRAGAEWTTRCPFHDDQKPSLRVNASKGWWYCDVCATGGDGIAFVMLKKCIGFAEAVQEVAA